MIEAALNSEKACSIEFQDKLWILGGFYNENGISTVSGCGLHRERIQIPPEHEWFQHKCEVYNEEIWICATMANSSGELGARVCLSFDGDQVRFLICADHQPIRNQKTADSHGKTGRHLGSNTNKVV